VVIIIWIYLFFFLLAAILLIAAGAWLYRLWLRHSGRGSPWRRWVRLGLLVLAALPLVAIAWIAYGWTHVYAWPNNTRPHSMWAALGDLDGDGDLDAYLANRENEGVVRDTVWFNQGDGKFTRAVWQPGEFESQNVVLGDVDGDGDLDALSDITGMVRLVFNDGAGSFPDRMFLEAPISGAYTFFPALGDLDNDGDLDAVLGGCCGDSLGRKPFNAVFFNDGRGRFTNSGQQFGASGTGMVALGDVDGDGDMDLFAANSSAMAAGKEDLERNQPNLVWSNDGKGGFTDSGQRLGADESYAVALGDLNGDGSLDAYSGNRGADTIWFNDGSGNFSDSGQRLGGDDTRLVVLADLDLDGDLDAFSAGRGFGQVWINQGGLQNGAMGVFKTGQRLDFSIWMAAALGDLDGDGDADVFTGLLDRAAQVWVNDGAGHFSLRP
jgi:hypothetical protein